MSIFINLCKFLDIFTMCQNVVLLIKTVVSRGLEEEKSAPTKLKQGSNKKV